MDSMSDTHLFTSRFRFCKYLPSQNQPIFPEISGCFRRTTENPTGGKDCLWPSALQLQSEYDPTGIFHVLRKSKCSRADWQLALLLLCPCHILCTEDQNKVSKWSELCNWYISCRSLRDRFLLLLMNRRKRVCQARESAWLFSKYVRYFWRVGKRIITVIITPDSGNLIF